MLFLLGDACLWGPELEFKHVYDPKPTHFPRGTGIPTCAAVADWPKR
jgi:hypothetical protein